MLPNCPISSFPLVLLPMPRSISSSSFNYSPSRFISIQCLDFLVRMLNSESHAYRLSLLLYSLFLGSCLLSVSPSAPSAPAYLVYCPLEILNHGFVSVHRLRSVSHFGDHLSAYFSHLHAFTSLSHA